MVFVFVGCSDNSIARRAVYGSIEGADGRSGLISFIPIDGKTGPAARTTIDDGNYEFDDSNGPVAGRYRVIVQLQKNKSSQVRSPNSTITVKGVDVPVSQIKELPIEYDQGVRLEVEVSHDGDLSLDLKMPSS